MPTLAVYHFESSASEKSRAILADIPIFVPAMSHWESKSHQRESRRRINICQILVADSGRYYVTDLERASLSVLPR